MKNTIKISMCFVTLFITLFVTGQNSQTNKPNNYLDLQWKQVATRMPDSWYGSEEAKSVAENVLLYQYEKGGWPKNTNIHLPLTDAGKAKVIKEKSEIGATFDNGATLTEMMFLAKVYANIKDERYHKAFKKAINYIFEAQYPNGGWPQFYPLRKIAYSSHITYNDNAMVNIMNFLRDVSDEKEIYVPMQINSELRAKVKKSFDKGIDCILKTQIIVNGKPTVWCAQHDEHTLAPANARAYELASFSGAESVGILQLLMSVPNPSPEIIRAVEGGISWLDKHKIENIVIESFTNSEGKKDRRVVESKGAPAQWARFYDLDTEKPYFCDRDGIKKSSLAEIGYERRNGYSWYTTSPKEVIQKYPEWAKKIDKQKKR